MERKIGEVFKYNGEWYQCVEGKCKDCYFSEKRFLCKQFITKDFCTHGIIFRKLQKLGEPFERNGYMYQEYKAHTYPLLMNGDAKIPTPNGFAVIIKQNKEDMEKKKLNLKPFDLEAAKAGKPVCTRDGRKVRIICFDAIGYHQPIIALVTNFDGKEDIEKYYLNGRFNDDINDISDYDLMMLPEKREGWVNVYKGNDGIPERVCGDIVSNTREEAIQCAQYDDTYITTVKIEWEE